MDVIWQLSILVFIYAAFLLSVLCCFLMLFCYVIYILLSLYFACFVMFSLWINSSHNSFISILNISLWWLVGRRMKIQILCTKDLRSNSKDLSWRFSFFESCINSIPCAKWQYLASWFHKLANLRTGLHLIRVDNKIVSPKTVSHFKESNSWIYKKCHLINCLYLWEGKNRNFQMCACHTSGNLQP